MRTALLLVAALSAGAAAAPDTPKTWLVLNAVDQRGRRPFNPDAVLSRYLLGRDAAPPREGEEVVGTTGKPQKWRAVQVDEKGRVSGGIAYAYAKLVCDRAQIVLARLPGGGRLWVNGDPFVGDIYASRHSGVPVFLREGENHIFVRGVRGRFRLTFADVEIGVGAADRDATLPDQVEGGQGRGIAGIVHFNASLNPVPGFVPLGVRKLAVPVDGETLGVLGTVFTLKTRKPGEAHRLTFRSGIDGSVQEFSVLPPLEPDGPTGLVLTLHGAGVDAYNQARSYSRKRDLWIVAATNRRPFGFDWQDWGRRDAYEVLEEALRFTRASPDRVYLTGHSMGGHGTWHLAANDADRFAAIAPSAGWATFDTYVGRTGSRLEALWLGADGSSRTLDLVSNLAQVPTFILHGSADDNVPAREAMLMETLLQQAGALPTVHYQKGAGHWWNGKTAEGVDCVDWPGIFEHFARHRRRKPFAKLDFLGADPGVDAEHYWLRVEQPLEYGKRFRIRATREGDTLRVTTTNVRRFRAAPPGSAGRVVVDGQDLRVVTPAWFLRVGKAWKTANPVPEEKSAARSGPFKRAFDNHFVFVYGDDEGMKRARYDAQAWWYRGNGDAPVMSDEQFLRGSFAGRNVILYGNAKCNRAWDAVLDSRCPIRMEEKQLVVGEANWLGPGLGCVFVYPRKGDPHALVGVFAHGDEAGARVGYALIPFVSGVGYPDYAAFNADVLTKGDGGVLAAGWFSHDWSLPR